MAGRPSVVRAKNVQMNFSIDQRRFRGKGEKKKRKEKKKRVDENVLFKIIFYELHVYSFVIKYIYQSSREMHQYTRINCRTV